MKLWKKVVTLVTFAIGVAGVAPAFAADAAKPGAQDLVLKGDAKCTSCHDEADSPKLLAIGKTKHGTVADGRTPTCTKCHGDSDKHANYKGKDKPPKPDMTFDKGSANPTEQRSEVCLSCHKKDAKRSHWEGSTHQTHDVACSSCHTVHAGKDKALSKKTQTEVCFTCHKEQRSQVNRISHHPILEGKVACSDCHNPHGSVGPKLMKGDSVVETCYACHAEKRGPFVWNHAPVSEDCAICHNPHGSNVESMLKTRPPFLCHQCHTPHGGNLAQLTNQSPRATSVGRNGITYTQGRGCVNCHTEVHGGNNPANAQPTPQFMLR
ncbi:MAG TPA: DmsE family decaheme c-type cytochrome [Noviherbaspirillum sp.]|uniref:DmsE family decaheme c-type cytochrome n=1 Tax=Noviherbaspirillum sp. TaxID=1926288 RepID=UPI002B48B582|nr:DmsE family decaheme c-type cytochrome [Noviherbaspirillum sp.]HJV88640.1 DmsE family decaheme c-type cytochrome [Noviherbaspirillum sp.]